MPFGKVGIVICFDRHLPDSICGHAGLVMISSANIIGGPMELFEQKVWVRVFQSTVFTAVRSCVGCEGAVTFAGKSLPAGPGGVLLHKAGAGEQLILTDISPEAAKAARAARPRLSL